MGNKRRSDEDKRIKDEGRSKKKHRTEEDKKERHKSRKHRSHSHKEKKSKNDQRDNKHHKRNKSSKHDFQELSSDDYFSKNNEFATWLREEKNVFFSDLSSESARDLFSSFIKAWNSQKLEPRYYEGITSGPRTAHNWNIRK